VVGEEVVRSGEIADVVEPLQDGSFSWGLGCSGLKRVANGIEEVRLVEPVAVFRGKAGVCYTASAKAVRCGR
jgi:hypothetical protein